MSSIPVSPAPLQIPLVPFGHASSLLLVVTYVICVAYCLIFPMAAMQPLWSGLLPGFTWLTWPSFFLGLVEVYAYGWYGAVIFVPIFNWFSVRQSAP